MDTETLIWRIVTNILANIKIRVRGHLASMNCERSPWENEKIEASEAEEILSKLRYYKPWPSLSCGALKINASN